MSELKSRLTIDLLARSHLSEDTLAQGDHDRIVSELFQLSRIRLPTMGLRVLENLECLGRVTHLYLAGNELESLDGIECLVDLRVLDVAGNRLVSVGELSLLQHLMWADLADNKISELPSLPPRLAFLRIRGNPCMSYPSFA